MSLVGIALFQGIAAVALFLLPSALVLPVVDWRPFNLDCRLCGRQREAKAKGQRAG